MNSGSRFFEETKEQSIVKTTIVRKYLKAWAKIILPTARRHAGRIAYMDLFAGPGRYADGTESTPLVVLREAIEDEDLRETLVTVFNDKDPKNVSNLKTVIQSLEAIERLKHKPQVWNIEVGEEIAAALQATALAPSLFFVDPWGYKGLSLSLIKGIVKDWGSECIFFFNYNRINMGLSNPAVREHMDALFGKHRAEELRQSMQGMDSGQRELAIVEQISTSLREESRFVLPFRFTNDKGDRTSHYLIFVTKNFRGYHVMKEIMANEISSRVQNVPSFEYIPSDRRNQLLFELSRPLEDLTQMLLKDFAGLTLTVGEIYKCHSVGRAFIRSNYKQALLELEAAGRIRAEPARRRAGTFGDNVKVTFPIS